MSEQVTMATLPVNELNRLVTIEEGLEDIVSSADGNSVDVDVLKELLDGSSDEEI